MRRSPGALELQLSDPRESQAVLIEVHRYGGVSRWGEAAGRPLEDRPTVEAGAKRLAELLQDERVWGLPPENLTLLQQPEDPADLLNKIDRAARRATDTLVVYYAGHGLLYPKGHGLYLALPATTKDLSYTALPYGDVSSVLSGAKKVRRKVVILDCCFSGQATATLSSSADEKNAVPLNHFAVEGTSILTAARGTEQASAPQDEKYPAFTGALISVLETGDTRGPELFSMGDLFSRVTKEMHGRGASRSQNPDQLNHVQGAQICIARNVRYEEPLAAEPPAVAPAKDAGIIRGRFRWALIGALFLLGMTVPIVLDHSAFSGTGSSQNSIAPSVLPGIKCGQVQDSFDPGDHLHAEVSIKVVHDAACKGDFTTMEVAMNRGGFDGLGFSAAYPDTVIAAWEKRSDRFALLRSLVYLLEQKPKVDQGGLTFSNGQQIAVWARGVETNGDTLLRWSGFYDCSQPPDSKSEACKLLR